MNRQTKIRVKTPVGPTDEVDTGEGVGQGTLEGAIVSAINLDNGVHDYFSDSEDELNYGDVRIQPLLYQDDVLRLATNIVSAQKGNDKMETLAETKLLDYNMDKSCFILFGSNKDRKKIEDELNEHPLVLYNKPMKQVKVEKYLGDFLSHSLEDSVAETVKRRKGQVVQSIVDIRNIIDDCRSQVVGGIVSGIDMWEMAVIPFLLYNSEFFYLSQ